jgi:hypothetical protein
MSDKVRPMEPDAAADALKDKLGGHKGDLTVADAAARSGLALRDAERALFRLLEIYPGNLKTTSEGELLFSFPRGLDKPREAQSFFGKLWSKSKRFFQLGARFLVRAWISVVMIGYAALFVAILIGLVVASASRDSDSKGIGGLGELLYVLFRVILEALFWTFHPAWHYYPDARPARRTWGKKKQKKEGVPFYEKVNRFVFGPEPPPEDPRATEQRVVQEIRRLRGRIGLSDVMRLTGMSREAAEPFLARLMLDYDGEVDVSDDGGITYRFEAVRKTAQDEVKLPPKTPALLEQLKMPPLTGNSGGSNFLIAALNGFNLVASLIALSLGVTIADVFNLINGLPLTADGLALVLGLIPAAFSAWLFALPIWRAIRRPAKRKELNRESGRRSVMRKVLDKLAVDDDPETPFSEGELKAAWKAAAGEAPSDKQLSRAVVELGGDLDIDDSSGRAQYRFRDLEAEVAALEAERASAQASEARVGEVVFTAEEVPG